MNERFKEDEQIRNELRTELERVVFSQKMKQNVLESLEPERSFWKKEIVIPLPVIAFALVLIVAIPIVGWRHAVSLQGETAIAERPNEEKIVVSSAGVFYESQLKREGDR